jgi:hypothetical protein
MQLIGAISRTRLRLPTVVSSTPIGASPGSANYPFSQ